MGTTGKENGLPVDNFRMDTVRVYRNISNKDKFFGLELADGCILLKTFFTVFLINRNGLFTNLALLMLVYMGLRTFKRGKPDGYLLVLARFLLSGRFKRTVRFDEAEQR